MEKDFKMEWKKSVRMEWKKISGWNGRNGKFL